MWFAVHNLVCRCVRVDMTHYAICLVLKIFNFLCDFFNMHHDDDDDDYELFNDFHFSLSFICVKRNGKI